MEQVIIDREEEIRENTKSYKHQSKEVVESPKERERDNIEAQHEIPLDVESPRTAVPSPPHIPVSTRISRKIIPGPGGDIPRVNSVKERALTLLKKGCLPLFPPAPREWDCGKTVTIPCGFAQICWPPSGWSSLTRDQRKLQLEFTAMMLERQANPTAIQSIHREALLAKYNMLTLPESDWPDRDGYRGVQYHNYEMLRKIAIQSAPQDPKRDEAFVTILEAAGTARDTATDYILDILEREKLELRLTV